MSKILIIAEHNGTELNPSTSKCVSCATAIDGEINIGDDQQINPMGKGIDIMRSLRKSWFHYR